MLLLKRPGELLVIEWLRAWQNEPLSYESRSLQKAGQPGFIADVHLVRLGHGEAVHHAACAALDSWIMFPPWAMVHPAGSPQTPGVIVAMVTRICGLWWVNPCRILRRCDSDQRHGFVYGTLPEHAECGEEQFVIERHPDGSVWYVIRAFSRPRHWLAWMGFPLARWWQCRFVRDSQNRMVTAVANPEPWM
jgi:uncharacterized protein (UPF0548 family)